MDFQGQTAFVSGGGRGIGRAICRTLADHGADVVVADLDEEERSETVELVESKGGTAHSVYLDLRDAECVESAVAEAKGSAGSIEILVNNAGIAGPTAPCEAVTVEEWDHTFDVNLRGMFLLTKAILPGMKSAEYGRIVNISSITGKRPLYHRTPYAASKLGVIGFTRTLAEEVGEFDINANAICPGSVEGPRITDVFERQAEARGTSYEAIREEAEQEAPRHELVQPEDIGDAVAFLCSDAAERITGEDLNVTAGKVMY